MLAHEIPTPTFKRIHQLALLPEGLEPIDIKEAATP
ncbi:hypothetical protein ANO14919_105300 [Xylariales sp. No.14919]|nr:hypothetical protein ANO14919_105300 [Xylariales sp. No.14919]